MNPDDEKDDEREFTPAEEVVYRMDLVIDALDVIERIIDSRPEGLVIPDADRRRMKALLLKMTREADELFELATTVAHLQTTLKKGTN
jgi:hypothetical protein